MLEDVRCVYTQTPAFDPEWNTHNHPVPSACHKHIKRLISNVECDLISLDAAINTDNLRFTSLSVNVNTTAAPDSLRSTRARLVERLNTLITSIAPHRRLPDDILLTIFALCIPEPFKVPLQRIWHHTEWALTQPPAWQTAEPWNLLTVCTRWRRLVLGAPTLWCNLVFQLRRMDHYARHAGFFKLLLSRSGASTPVKLTIRVEDCNLPWNSDAVAHLVSELVVAHASRLKELTLTLPAPVLDPFLILPSAAVRFDQLEAVVLEYPARGVVNNVLMRRGFSDAPRLRRFTINAKLPSHSLELPWNQLLELHLVRTTGTSEDCHRIMQRCSSLVSCTIIFFEDTSSPPHSLPNSDKMGSTTLHNLTTFTLDCNPIAPFLTHVHLPALEALILQTDVDHATCEATLLPFLHRCPRLTHLTLTWWVPSDTIKTILLAVPLLTHLHFVPGKTAEVFKLLWAVDLAPKLECLTFMCYPIVWDEVVEIIGLRRLVGRLREVHVVTFFRKDVDLWEKDPRLRTLREVGMRLELTNIVQGRYS